MTDIKKIINATGVVIHTNLGRSPLPQTSIDTISKYATRYFPLEYDLSTGERGHRDRLVEDLMCELTGAEMATVVNNNAGGVLLTLNTLAKDSEVLVSRGELIEIGGSFRLPEVIKASGCILKRVGNVNRTTISDFQNAISRNTKAILISHRSNFFLRGEDTRPELKELINLADQNNIPLIYDEGSGNLTDEIVSEAPTIKEAIKAGVDIVLSSGDKLLGGPQAGLIIGRKRYIEAIRKNHLLRTLRTGKLTYLALYAILTLYKQDRLKDIPNLEFITRDIDFLEKTADSLSSKLNKILGDSGKAKVLDDISRVGGGTLPHLELKTRVVLVDISGFTPHSLRDKMRSGVPPVIGRLRDEGFVLDVRTLFDGDIEEIVDVVKEIID